MGSEMCIRDRAVLAQEDGRPLGFFSRKLSAEQRKYSAFDKELLGIKESIQHFRHMVEGRKFTLFTDHKPLTLVMPTTTTRTPRQERHLSYISEFRHVKGDQNHIANHLSRPIMAALLPAADLEMSERSGDPCRPHGYHLSGAERCRVEQHHLAL